MCTRRKHIIINDKTHIINYSNALLPSSGVKVNLKCTICVLQTCWSRERAHYFETIGIHGTYTMGILMKCHFFLFLVYTISCIAIHMNVQSNSPGAPTKMQRENY